MNTGSSVYSLRTLIGHELRTLMREGTFSTLFGIFFTVTLFAVFIGWKTRTTTAAIYDATASLLRASGATHIAGNPLLGTSALSIFNNLIVYTLLVGALLAIVIGHRSFVRDRKSGVIPLLFSRPAGRPLYIAGKLCGITTVLFSVMVCMFAVSALSTILVPSLHLTGSEIFSLLDFYAVSFLYLAFFAALGMLFAVWMPNESLALLVPIIVWIIIVFILPELSTGQNPVSLLNPVTLAQAPVAPGAFFSISRSLFGPFSLGQEYTSLALHFLRIGTAEFNAGYAATLAAALAIVTGASMFALQRYSVSADVIAQ